MENNIPQANNLSAPSPSSLTGPANGNLFKNMVRVSDVAREYRLSEPTLLGIISSSSRVTPLTIGDSVYIQETDLSALLQELQKISHERNEKTRDRSRRSRLKINVLKEFGLKQAKSNSEAFNDFAEKLIENDPAMAIIVQDLKVAIKQASLLEGGA